MRRIVFWSAPLLWVVLVSAASPWPQPWKWTVSLEKPSLTLLLGGAVVRQDFDLPPQATTLELILKKYRMEQDGVVVVWKDGSEAWLKTQKKIPGSQSAESVLLPPGSLITLAVSSRNGTLLAEIILRRK